MQLSNEKQPLEVLLAAKSALGIALNVGGYENLQEYSKVKEAYELVSAQILTLQ